MAQKLFLSVETVKWYNKQIFSELRVNSRAQAAAFARQSSLLELPATLPGKEKIHPWHNLPLRLKSLLGREKEIDRIKRWLSPALLQANALQKKVRLVTLTGPGGVGRLAWQFGLPSIWWINFQTAPG